MSKYDFDLIVVGAGTAGIVAAVTARGLGKKVLLVEKSKAGGKAYLNTSFMLKSLASLALDIHNIEKYKKNGLSTDLSFNIKKFNKNVSSNVSNISKNLTPEAFSNIGVNYKKGCLKFISNHQVKVDNKKFSSDKILIATGSNPFLGDIRGISNISYILPEDVLKLKELPHSLIIVGAGSTGIEYAFAFSALGVKTVLIDKKIKLMETADFDISKMIYEELSIAGVTVLEGFCAEEVKTKNNKISLHCVSHDGKGKTISASDILLCTGRTPNLQNMDLLSAGLNVSENNPLYIDEYLRSSVKNIYFAGDSNGRFMYNNAAEVEASIAVNNMFNFIKKKIDYSLVPISIYAGMKYSFFGLTPNKLKLRKYRKCKIHKFPLNYSVAALTQNADQGIVKVITDSSNKIAGAHVFSKDSDSIINELVVMKYNNVRFDTLSFIPAIFPSSADSLKHISKRAYINRIERNPFQKIVSVLFSRKK